MPRRKARGFGRSWRRSPGQQFRAAGIIGAGGGGDTKFGFNYGVGVKVKILDNWLLRGDFRQYETGKPFNLPNSSGRLFQNEISIGFAFAL